MFQRFRKDPAAFDAYLEQLVAAVGQPIRAKLQAARQSRVFPEVTEAPEIAVDELFSLTDRPEKTVVSQPIQSTPPSVVVPDPEPVVRPPRPVPTPVAQAPLADTVVASRPAVPHQVDYAVPQVTPPSPSVKPIVAPPIIEETTPTPLPETQVVPPKAAAPEGEVTKVQSKDLAAAEKRRKDREEMLSSLMKKDQGKVL